MIKVADNKFWNSVRDFIKSRGNVRRRFSNDDVIIWYEQCDFFSSKSEEGKRNLNPGFFQKLVDSSDVYVFDNFENVTLPTSDMDIELPWSIHGSLYYESNRAFLIDEDADGYTGFIFSNEIDNKKELYNRLNALIKSFEYGFSQGHKQGERDLGRQLRKIIFPQD